MTDMELKCDPNLIDIDENEHYVESSSIRGRSHFNLKILVREVKEESHRN